MIKYDNRKGFRLLFNPSGSVFRSTFPAVLVCTILSMFVSLYNHYVAPISINPTPWAIVGGALGLLLVFRTNTAYDRYWEGRKQFGTITGASKLLSLSLLAGLNNDYRKEKQKLIQLLIAYPILVVQQLREEECITAVDDMLKVLTPEEADIFRNSQHKPNTILLLIKDLIYRCIAEGKLRDNLVHLESCIEQLSSAAAACDRIKNTPIPIAYVLHIKSLLMVFSATLPMGFVEALGWYSPLVTLFVSYAFIGIEEIGVEIEDPFGMDPNDLPLDELCLGVKKTLNDLYEQDIILDSQRN